MKLAVWYHCALRGHGINEDHAIAVLHEQMNSLRLSGVMDSATEIHVGVNGNDSDSLTVCAFLPERSIRVHVHTNDVGQSELTTLARLQKWLEPGWFVCYHHIKGVSYPGNPVWERWRRCMERVCIRDWEACVDALDRGCDVAGAHWLTHEKYTMVPPSQRYFGGNFWWARSEYLLSLPPVAKDSRENRYEAEVWIGSGKKKPIVMDFAPHFPMNCPV